MGYPNVVRLKKVQSGVETARGVPVAVTRRTYGRAVRRHNQEIVDIPDEEGTYFGGEAVAAGDAELTFQVEATATHDDLHYWLDFALNGAVVPVVLNGATTRTYVPLADVDNLKTETWEHGWPGRVYRSDMVGLSQLTLAIDRGASPAWRVTAELFARHLEAIADYTAGIPSVSRDAILARGTKLFVDDMGTAVGTTQLERRFRSASVTIQRNPDFKRFGESDEYVAEDFGLGQLVVTGEVVLEAVDDVEYEKQRLTEARGIRFEQVGEEIAGSTGSINKRTRIDIGRAFYNAPSEDTAGQNLTDSFGFVGKPNAGAAPISVELVQAA